MSNQDNTRMHQSQHQQRHEVSYGTLINAAAKDNNLTAAQDWFAKMVSARIEPSEVTLQTVRLRQRIH